ncbi:hypothetical protein [Streptomyces sp. CMB-StM0423]|uniref:hypothetical protein n=1 Tax=Streptomyces sp. CMB-StM0423 TaxID=2059884 RepID=UPI000C6FD040|nr:hypothetical protein [Streptomyces sp. CMB-StM0423]AUH42203.1 hypothetical protein CXR04_20135 [Streptomyces sp. CMB-StM0423]
MLTVQAGPAPLTNKPAASTHHTPDRRPIISRNQDSIPPPPYIELRIGDFHLTLQRRPVRLLTTALIAAVLLLAGGSAWAVHLPWQ